MSDRYTFQSQRIDHGVKELRNVAQGLVFSHAARRAIADVRNVVGTSDDPTIVKSGGINISA